jgi:hypothetical protein
MAATERPTRHRVRRKIVRKPRCRCGDPCYDPVCVALLCLSAAVAAGSCPGSASRDEGHGPRRIHSLQARRAYEPTTHKQGNRWIAHIGHHGGTKEVPKPRNPLTGAEEFNGTSIIDVTDPSRPKYLVHIPADEGLAEQGGARSSDRFCLTLGQSLKSRGYIHPSSRFRSQRHDGQ